MKKILVIEDEEPVLDNILKILGFEKFQAFGARNGVVGLEVARQVFPDLIMCDIMMPELDGYGVLNEVRKDPSISSIPFIFLTAKVDRTDLRFGMDLGADDYLTKPFTRQELLNAINARVDKQVIVEKKSRERLDELTSSISRALPHEFRSPLNGIIGLSQVLIDEYETIERSELLEMIKEIKGCGERLNRLVQNFLIYAEIEITAAKSDKKEIFQSKNYINDIIKSIAFDKATDSDRKDDLTLSLVDDGVRISLGHFSKIFQEIIDNAFKYSLKGQGVYVKTEISEGIFNLYVIDKGRGMTSDEVKRIGAYLQFGRRIYEQQGIGLGMAIARRLIELSGGTFEIESIKGEGTTVHICLPM